MERTLDELRASIPAPARDMALNLQNVLAPGGALDTNQRYEVALACALTTQHPELIAAMRAEASAAVPEGVIEDARAAAALMAMAISGVNWWASRMRVPAGTPAARARAPKRPAPSKRRRGFADTLTTPPPRPGTPGRRQG